MIFTTHIPLWSGKTEHTPNSLNRLKHPKVRFLREWTRLLELDVQRKYDLVRNYQVARACVQLDGRCDVRVGNLRWFECSIFTEIYWVSLWISFDQCRILKAVFIIFVLASIAGGRQLHNKNRYEWLIRYDMQYVSEIIVGRLKFHWDVINIDVKL